MIGMLFQIPNVNHAIRNPKGEVAWAVPGKFTVHNFPCSEDGKNCVVHKKAVETQYYEDPSKNIEAVHRRLKSNGNLLRN